MKTNWIYLIIAVICAIIILWLAQTNNEAFNKLIEYINQHSKKFLKKHDSNYKESTDKNIGNPVGKDQNTDTGNKNDHIGETDNTGVNEDKINDQLHVKNKLDDIPNKFADNEINSIDINNVSNNVEFDNVKKYTNIDDIGDDIDDKNLNDADGGNLNDTDSSDSDQPISSYIPEEGFVRKKLATKKSKVGKKVDDDTNKSNSTNKEEYLSFPSDSYDSDRENSFISKIGNYKSILDPPKPKWPDNEDTGYMSPIEPDENVEPDGGVELDENVENIDEKGQSYWGDQKFKQDDSKR
jgi:hypothetical protein